jgi:16S rRNA (cytidine1402-2'-O)-methyltransferase
LSASFAPVLDAARHAAGSQHYPQGALYVVATPIGNLADITLRALHVLQLADTLACEDTRHSHSLLRAYGIDKPSSQWLAVHQHNEAQAAQEVLARLQAGQRVVYMSDAGTPGISDPGARLAAAVAAAGLRVLPLPGASSITTALSVAGAVAQGGGDQGFVFAGFLPTRSAERGRRGDAAHRTPLHRVLEAPHRIDLAAGPGRTGGAPGHAGAGIDQAVRTNHHPTRPPALRLGCRKTPSAAGVNSWWCCIRPRPATGSNGRRQPARAAAAAGKELPLKTAVRLAADITGAAAQCAVRRRAGAAACSPT